MNFLNRRKKSDSHHELINFWQIAKPKKCRPSAGRTWSYLRIEGLLLLRGVRRRRAAHGHGEQGRDRDQDPGPRLFGCHLLPDAQPENSRTTSYKQESSKGTRCSCSSSSSSHVWSRKPRNKCALRSLPRLAHQKEGTRCADEGAWTWGCSLMAHPRRSVLNPSAAPSRRPDAQPRRSHAKSGMKRFLNLLLNLAHEQKKKIGSQCQRSNFNLHRSATTNVIDFHLAAETRCLNIWETAI